MKRNSLKDQILEINQDYLGPAAERFVERQISTHLNKDPSAITRSDLLKLIDWFKLSFALLTDDMALVDEYSKRLSLLARGDSAKAIGKNGGQSGS